MLAEVAEVVAFVEQIARRLRDQNLTAMPSGHHPGSVMHVEAHVPVLDLARLARVDADTDADLAVLGHSCPASARCAWAAAATASFAAPKATKKESPSVSTSKPP